MPIAGKLAGRFVPRIPGSERWSQPQQHHFCTGIQRSIPQGGYIIQQLPYRVDQAHREATWWGYGRYRGQGITEQIRCRVEKTRREATWWGYGRYREQDVIEELLYRFGRTRREAAWRGYSR